MQFGSSTLFTNAPKVTPFSHRAISPDEAEADLFRRQSAMDMLSSLAPCQLVHRNYFWMLFDDVGIIADEYNYDDFSSTPRDFDFMTVSLMGFNVVFADSQGRPAPYPRALEWINCGEVPDSRRFWVQVGFLDPFLDHNSGTVQLRPWSCAVQVGVFGWKFA